MASRITESQRQVVLEMLAEGHDRETIAAHVGITPAQVSAVAAHVRMGTYTLPRPTEAQGYSAASIATSDAIEPVTTRTTNLLRQLHDLTPSSLRVSQMAPVLLGTDAETGEEVCWNPDPHSGSANPHVLVIGESGFGKTYTVSCLLAELAQQSISSIVFDYGQGFSLEAVPKEFLEWARPSEIQASSDGIDINPLQIFPSDLHGPVNVAQRLADTFGRVYSQIGVQQHAVLRQAVLDIMADVGISPDAKDSWLQADADPFTAKRQSLFLTRRGGKGKPHFVSPFLGGQGTTCGEWTRPMVRKPDGTLIKGFMKAAVAVGFCPVECPYCYLNMPYTDGMDVAMNWEDLADELKRKWRSYQYPINFGETSGLVEYDEWFSGAQGEGSMIQFVIDACAEADVTPFFLTKIRYPRYLRFRGKVQVGISLMPESVRQWVAPNGSPAEDLLDSLAWAWSAGARDPVIRMTVIWQQREVYPEFLELCRDRLGTSGWRLTLDILRFTPVTASIIAKRYPEASASFAKEIEPDTGRSLRALAREAKGAEEHVKKTRPTADRQAEIFIWFREQLNQLGCHDVMLTPCKGDPDELTPLARLKVIRAMPCACYGARRL